MNMIPTTLQSNLKHTFMTRYTHISIIIVVLLGLFTLNVSAQFSFPFGDISTEDLSGSPYKPDPGADAIILSETGIASLQYQKGFFVEFEKDIRIRIVNSNGYDYANIEIPYSVDDYLDAYKASTFNLRNGVKTETPIPKKNFILERTSPSQNTLKFNFTDVHEGSVIEFTYKIRLKGGDAIFSLVPWEFQSEIPVISSSFTVAYPDAFVYKSLISGSAMDVQTSFSSANTNFFGESVTESIRTWTASNVPAFRTEPYILSSREHLTRLTFELAKVDFPDITLNNISPTYQTLNEKLLDRWDFGIALNTNLNSLAESVTSGVRDELTKLKKIHKYISSRILWNGYAGVAASSTLRNVLRKDKGSSADINMILIIMLRAAGMKADPVILSTRSNGSLNLNSAILQQFNYLVAAVKVDGTLYMVDATDPLRPFNMLPFYCMNNTGRLISLTESRFVELKNNENYNDSLILNLVLDKEGNLDGKLTHISSGYSSYNVRTLFKLESEEGYIDIFKSLSPDAKMSAFRFTGVKDPESDLTMTCDLKMDNLAQVAGDMIIINPFLSLLTTKNIFYSPERKFPVNFGCPITESYSLKLIIPEDYSVVGMPSDILLDLGKGFGRYESACALNGNEIVLNSRCSIIKTFYPVSEYKSLRDFYNKRLQKEAELIILKKNPVIKK
jgi:Domain of Unknown Function with PDB structure (DUF3857)/Transglutaminase-like superfamily